MTPTQFAERIAAGRIALANYTVDDLIHWLRNGHTADAKPFLRPGQILKSDPGLEVNWNVRGDREVSVFDPLHGFFVYAPLNTRGEIIWEDWQVIDGESKG